MKHFLFAMIAVALISCNSNDTKVAGSEDKTDHMEMAKKNTEKMKAVYHAIETGDVSGLDSLIADDAVDHNGNPDGTDVKGKENIKKMLAEIHTYFDNLKMEYMSDATSADGEYQFSSVRMTGKAKANPWGMPVGMDMDETSVDMVKIKDGKATDHWNFMSMKDVHEMMQGMKGNSMPAGKDTATIK
jgi:ketosteroid isomerase-like protein